MSPVLTLPAEDAGHRRVLALEHPRRAGELQDDWHRRPRSSRCSLPRRGCRTAPRGRRPWRTRAPCRGSRPSSRSVSSCPNAAAWLNASVVGMPPGAAEKKVFTASSAVRLTSQRCSASASVSAWTVATEVSISPARSSSPRMRHDAAGCDARPRHARLATEGATLHRTGHAARQAVDVEHGERHLAFLRRGQQMQHRVGGPAHGDVERHGVLERGEGGDAARQHRDSRRSRSGGG